MGRRAVEIEIQLLHVLAMVAFGIGQAKQALLENRIAPVPKRDAHAPVEFFVAEAADAVLAPAVRAAACLVMRKVLPGGAVRAVILAHGAPLAFAQVRAPAAPASDV